MVSRAQPWLDRLSRIGFVAKAFVYLMVGGLAFLAAAGRGGKTTDPSGALADAAGTAIGRLLLGLIALGLIAHAAFRALLAIIGEPYGARTPVRRLVRRFANAAGALVYLGLAATAAALSLGLKSSSAHNTGDTAMQSWSAKILRAPLGRPVLIAVAGGITVAAIVQLVRVMRRSTGRQRLRVENMSERERAVVAVVGRLAFLSRAVILATIAYYLWRTAIDRAPGEARGPGGALHAAWEYPHGNVLLALMAAGIFSVGAFALLEARWRRLFGG